MTIPNTAPASIYLKPEHEMLRDQVRRFVREEVLPHGARFAIFLPASGGEEKRPGGGGVSGRLA